MSWTVKHDGTSNSQNALDIEDLDKALLQAAKTKLVFCSGPDIGNIDNDELQLYRPVGATVTSVTENIFRIGAASSDGNPWPRSGNKNVVDYTLPGFEVLEIEGEEVVPDDKSPKTGSSIATALAAGLAALIIHVVRLAAIRTFELSKQDELHVVKAASLKAIKSFTGMRQVFDDMSQERKGDLCVHVHKYFEQNGRNLNMALDGEDSNSEKTRKWNIIEVLARALIPQKIEDKTP